MTANEMWDNVLVTYDALYSQSAPGFVDPEASIILTKAQWYYVLQRINPKSNRNMEGFEETEIRIQELSSLVKDSQVANPPISLISNQAGALPGETLWAIPVDCMLPIYEGCTTSTKQCGSNPAVYNRIMTIPISHDEYNLNFSNPYKKPWTDGTEGIIWRLEHGTKNVTVNSVTQERKIHGIIYSTDPSLTVTNYYMRYIKYPEDIQINLSNPSSQVNCKLDPISHQSICDIAVKLLSAAVREQIPANQLSAENLE
jgi:hypothetical protein